MKVTGLSYVVIAGILSSGFALAETYDEPREHATWISAADPRHYGFPIDGASVLPGMPYYQSLRKYWESHHGPLPEDHLVAPIANIILPQAGRVLSFSSSAGEVDLKDSSPIETSESDEKEGNVESYHDYNVDAFMKELSLLLDAVIPEEIKQEVYKREAGY